MSHLIFFTIAAPRREKRSVRELHILSLDANVSQVETHLHSRRDVKHMYTIRCLLLLFHLLLSLSFFSSFPSTSCFFFSPFLHTPPPPPPTARIHLYTPFPLAFFLFFFCHNVSVCKQNSTKNQQTLVSLFLPSKKPVRKKKSPVSTTSLQNSSKGICHGSLPYLMYFPTCIPRHLLLHRPTCISSSSLSFLQVRKCQLW